MRPTARRSSRSTNHAEMTIALLALHAGFSHSAAALYSLAAYCRNEPFHGQLRLHEAGVGGRLDWLLERLLAERPGLLGISTYLWNIEPALRLVRQIEQLLPETTIVLGGPEAGPRGEELLARFSALDYVIDGEGEEPFRRLARWSLYGEGAPGGIPGLVYRDADRVRRNPPEPLPAAAIPSPLRHGGVPSDKPLIYWETARGCPFTCSFCTSAEDPLRARPEGEIEADLALLAGMENKTVKLLDRSFHLGRRRTLSLLERFLETPASLRFHLELNPDRISAEALALFARAPAGKFQFEIGLQTLDAGVLTAIERRMDVDLALANIRSLVQLRRHPVHLDLIAGLPGEDFARCRRDLDRTFALHPDHLQLGTLKLLPGTPLRDRAEGFGYRFDPQPPYEVLCHDALAFSELMHLKRYAELLERLWNSGLLRHTLAHLVSAHYDDSVADLFDAVLEASGDTLAGERAGPERAFLVFADFLAGRLAADPALAQLFAWDYAGHTLPGAGTPAALRGLLGESEVVKLEGQRKRLPVLQLGAPAASLIAKLRGEPLAPGRYALWPQKHRRGRPLTVIPLPE